MSEENLEVVRRFMDAWNRSDAPAGLALMDPDIEVEVAMGTPLDGTYQGHEGVLEFLTEIWQPFTDIRSELDECIPAGDNVVLGVRHHGTGTGSGAEVEMRHWQVCTISDGKVVRWSNVATREEALRAAGISE